MNRILVAILNFHQHEYVIRLLSSLENQNGKFNLVIYIGDMLAKPEEKEYFKKEVAKFNFSKIRYEYLTLDENIGYARGNNYIIRKATDKESYDYVLISNPDIEISGVDLIQHLVNCINSKKRAASIGPKVIQPGGRQQGPYLKQNPIIYGFKHFLPFIWLPFWFIRETYAKRINKISHVWRTVGAFMLIKFEPFNEIGMFDETTFLYWEEDIMSLKFQKSNYEIFYDPTESVKHLNANEIRYGISKYDIDSMKYFFKLSGYGSRSISFAEQSIKFYNLMISILKKKLVKFIK